jgi:hypothetical protein
MIMGEPPPERLRNAPPIIAPTRPLVVKTNGSNGASSEQLNALLAEQNEAIKESEELRKIVNRRRRSARISQIAFALFLAFVFGSAYIYSRPEGDVSQELSKTVHGTHFTANYPEGWTVPRSEANIIQLDNTSKGWQITFSWQTAQQIGISPSRELSSVAQELQNNDYFGRQFQSGEAFTVGTRPAYSFAWNHPRTGEAGYIYIFFDPLNNFYEVTAKVKNAEDLPALKELADTILAQIAFK